ncbi:MAG: hypothetical protein WCO56_14095 [Verrucomicrobiota bacterium]
MPTRVNRRDFVKGTAFASAATMALCANATPAQAASAPVGDALPPQPPQQESLPMGKIGKVELSRLMLGGNLLAGYAHARDLRYVSQLMRRYNTEAKILETLALAESLGINCVNTPVWDENVFLEKHWKRGGKMKWIAQAKLGENFDLVYFKKAMDMGACGVHMQGHVAEQMVEEDRVDVIAKSVELVQRQGGIAGVGAHGLEVIKRCEQAGVPADFYVKTLHGNKYPTAPRSAAETGKWGLGNYDNCWCNNPQEVIEFFADVKKPWIAFKVMAAGAIPPAVAFPHAFNNGADFVLAGMFDWQVEENVALARKAVLEAQRERGWRGT